MKRRIIVLLALVSLLPLLPQRGLAKASAEKRAFAGAESPPRGGAQAAKTAPRCRGAGLSPDAPLYYLELLSDADAARDDALVAMKDYEEVAAHLPSGAPRVEAMNRLLEAARSKAGIRPLGSAGARLSVKKAARQSERLENMTIRARDPQRVDEASDKRGDETLPFQYRLNYAYKGLATRAVILADLNHDGIMDFLHQGDPVLRLTDYSVFIGCGDNWYTPAGMFITRYGSDNPDADKQTRRKEVNGVVWDEFHVVAPDLPDDRNPSHDDPLFNWARRVIAFDPDKGFYREMSVEPLR